MKSMRLALTESGKKRAEAQRKINTYTKYEHAKIVLRMHPQGITYHGIADELKCSPNAVRIILRDAVRDGLVIKNGDLDGTPTFVLKEDKNEGQGKAEEGD
jgi:hypothetical protein